MYMALIKIKAQPVIIKLDDLHYYRPLVRKITNLFKQIEVNIVFCITNAVYDLMKSETHNTLDEYTNWDF